MKQSEAKFLFDEVKNSSTSPEIQFKELIGTLKTTVAQQSKRALPAKYALI